MRPMSGLLRLASRLGLATPIMQIAYQIAHYGHGEFEHIHDEIPWPESPMPGIVSH